MSSIMHSTESEADNGAEKPTRALEAASDFKHAIDGHVITVVAGADGVSPHVNGTSCWLNNTIFPFPDGRAEFIIPRVPMARPAKALPGSAFTLTLPGCVR